MTNFLYSKNKIGFVDGSIKMPNTGAQRDVWKRCDAMIKGWLTTAMEKDIRNSVKYAESAKEIWDDLKERFGKENAPRTYELKRELTLIRQEKATVPAYYTRLRGLWDEIQSVSPTPKCSCGLCICEIGKRLQKAREREQLYEFLMGLDEAFNTVRSQILTTKPAPTLGAAYHMVAEDERQRLVSDGRRQPQEVSAFVAQPKSSSMEGTNSASYVQQQHLRRSEGKRTGAEEVVRCKHCNRTGHAMEGCFKIIGYPEWWPGKTGKKEGNKPTDRRDERRTNPRAGHVDSGQILGVTADQLAHLFKQYVENDKFSSHNTSPTVNMAGLTLEEPDWRG
ncbi:unnamed protein product [Cuscuta epithymum]|uniref:Retrotransposon gag domain-containing protein n=1 Tax=Cuscuta epithymum TaxID=186058 RepID=A0AAV0CW65_9ASTE|nr:unnamed protein product [Cuscuta epithymum]